MSKRKKRKTKKERRHEAQARAAHGVARSSNPHIDLFARKLSRSVDSIIARGNVTKDDVQVALGLIEVWEGKNRGGFKTNKEGRQAVSDVVLKAVKAVAQVAVKQGREWSPEMQQDVTDAAHCIFGYKGEALRASKRLALPEGQGAVETYLACEKSIYEGCIDDSGQALRDLEDRGRDEGLRLARSIWARLKQARVFEFPAETWRGLHQTVERSMAGWIEGESRNHFDEDVGVVTRMQHASHAVEFPQKLPFETSYIGIGAGVVLPDEWARSRVIFHNEASSSQFIGAELFGYLICEAEQQVYEMVHVITEDDDYILPLAQRYSGVWGASETLGPWLVHGLVSLINEHNTVTINNRPTQRMKLESKSSGRNARGFFPKPYYTLRMRRKVVDESKLPMPKSEGKGSVLTRRYDRRGHERVRVHRGLLPITEKEEAKLLKSGYRFIHGRPGSEDAERLAYRELAPKRSDEWMAIKVSWIDDTIVGDENLPYIPAVRVPANKKAS